MEARETASLVLTLERRRELQEDVELSVVLLLYLSMYREVTVSCRIWCGFFHCASITHHWPYCWLLGSRERTIVSKRTRTIEKRTKNKSCSASSAFITSWNFPRVLTCYESIRIVLCWYLESNAEQGSFFLMKCGGRWCPLNGKNKEYSFKTSQAKSVR